MLKHFCECYSDLSGPILCPVLGSITPLFIPNSRIRPIRLIGLCASLITFLYPLVPRIQFDPSTAKSQFVESLQWLPYENIHLYMGIDGLSLFFMILNWPLPVSTFYFEKVPLDVGILQGKKRAFALPESA